MINFELLSEFSMTHCAALCAFLVPANLLASLQLILFAAFERPGYQRWLLAVVSGLYAAALALHDFSWFMVGVVRTPTFVLFGLALLCLGINFWTIAFPRHWVYIRRRLQQIGLKLQLNVRIASPTVGVSLAASRKPSP